MKQVFEQPSSPPALGASSEKPLITVKIKIRWRIGLLHVSTPYLFIESWLIPYYRQVKVSHLVETVRVKC